MVVLLHVVLALASLTLSSVNVFRPSIKLQKMSYGLAAGTLSSGVALIFINNASVLRTCVTGLIFFAVVTAMNEVARKRLSLQKAE
jgi:hypothetical protein